MAMALVGEPCAMMARASGLARILRPLGWRCLRSLTHQLWFPPRHGWAPALLSSGGAIQSSANDADGHANPP